MSQSNYPSRAKLLDVIQEAGMNREGLVADCVLPEVRTQTNMFEWIDFATTSDNNGRFDNLRELNDVVGCTSEVKEIDPSSFDYKQGKVTDKAQKMALKDCHQSACTPDGRLPFDVDAAKSEELVDRLLLTRELRVIKQVLDETKYTTQAVADIEDDAEGAIVDFSGSFGSDAVNHLNFFRALQRNNFSTGMRNVVVMSQYAFDRLVEHPSFKPGGCAIPPLAQESTIAGYLGVQKICIADTAINKAAAGADFSLGRIWAGLTDDNDDYMLFTKSIKMATPDAVKRGFGFSAYKDGFGNRVYFDPKKGKDGTDMQVVHHDFTEVIADIKAATLVKIRD